MTEPERDRGSQELSRSSADGVASAVSHPPDRRASLQDLLAETRILLPGTEVFLAFLVTLPFSSRFAELGTVERTVYLCTFFSTLLAFACFVAPTAYHRITGPIHDKERFKVFANTFLVIGLAPVSLSVILATFLVTSIVVGRTYAVALAAAMAFVVAVLWWIIPLTRAHDRVRVTSRPSSPSGLPAASPGSPHGGRA